ncbi:MAG TPA: MerR family transcriptional regulator [Chloroflexota bacterium]|jgi:DNA-binding transcriptional MerR regulator
MRIKAASQALDVPVPTLRRWTQEFAPGLSPEARASEGRPRAFSPRDMRLLRRAKEILRSDDVTYERARRLLGGEGLLSYEADPAAGGRDDAADREAAERFVREIVDGEVGPVREAHDGLTARLAELEEEIRALREQLRGTLGSAAGSVRPARQEAAEPDRRRTWPFR